MDETAVTLIVGLVERVETQVGQLADRLGRMERIVWTMMGAIAVANVGPLTQLVVSLYNGAVH